jgi:hypothetical protein
LISNYLGSLAFDVKRAFIIIFLAGMFLYGFIYILNQSKVIINVIFSFALFSYFVMSLITLIGYYDKNFNEIWAISGFIYFIAPLGIYLSIKLIINQDVKLPNESWYIIFSTFFFAILSIYFYDKKTKLNIVIADLFIILLIGLTIFELYTNREDLTISKRTFKTFLVGLLVVELGLFVNLVLFVITQEMDEIRLAIPLIGLLIIIISFKSVHYESINDDISKVLFREKLANYKEKLDEILPKISNYFMLRTSTDNNKLVDRKKNDKIDKLSLEKAIETKISSNEPENEDAQIEYNEVGGTTEKEESQKAWTNNKKFAISTEEEDREFKDHLKEELNGLTIGILIETAMVFPKGVTNILLQKKLKKSKTTILDQTTKLVNLGYLKKGIDLNDIRKKPILLTDKGYKFLSFLHTTLEKVIIKENLNLYSFTEIISIET